MNDLLVHEQAHIVYPWSTTEQRIQTLAFFLKMRGHPLGHNLSRPTLHWLVSELTNEELLQMVGELDEHIRRPGYLTASNETTCRQAVMYLAMMHVKYCTPETPCVCKKAKELFDWMDSLTLTGKTESVTK